MAKNKLPVNVVSNTTTSNASPMKMKNEDEAWQTRERKYKAEEALSTIERAEGHKRDKALMRDVKALAKDKIKCLDKNKMNFFEYLFTIGLGVIAIAFIIGLAAFAVLIVEGAFHK